MDQETLERKLHAIQELKSQYYIGSQQAKQWLESYDHVEEAFHAATERVARQAYAGRYPITPARMVGASRMVECFFDGISVGATTRYPDEMTRLAVAPLHESELLEALCITSPIGALTGSALGGPAEAEQCGLWENCFGRLFMYVSSGGRPNDKALRSYAVRVMKHACDPVLEASVEPDVLQELIDSAVASCQQLITNMDFTAEYRSEFDRCVKTIQDRCVREYDILDRIHNDQVQDRSEYRRQVATLWASRNDAADADQLISYTRALLERRRQRATQCTPDIYPRSYVADVHKLAERTRQVLEILETERTFLDRYLKA